jgi:Holliday junction DNA helicase RuvA
VLDVNNVGYLVSAPRGFLEKKTLGEEIDLHIHTHVREDAISLYGFSTQEEWQLFELLLTVSGVGPRSALEILNAPLTRVRHAIAKKDSAFLTQIPGIGKKTAERIIIDLEGKIKEELLVEETGNASLDRREDLIAALISLGYSRQQVTSGLKKIPQEIENEEAVIKYFLQNT